MTELFHKVNNTSVGCFLSSSRKLNHTLKISNAKRTGSFIFKASLSSAIKSFMNGLLTLLLNLVISVYRSSSSIKLCPRNQRDNIILFLTAIKMAVQIQ